MVEATLAQLGSDPEVTVVVVTGTEHWRAGEITLRVHGSGAVEVEHRRSGEHGEYDGTLDAGELAELGAELDRAGFTTLAPDRTTLRPDEHAARLELRRGDDMLHRQEMPQGDDRLDGILAAYRRVVEQITDGALPYGKAAAPR